MSKAGRYADGEDAGIYANGYPQDEATASPLRVVIVGAGIGGLTAAIALRQVGHKVVVLEQWSGGNETGAAIHLAPNANGVLRRLGLYAEKFGGNLMRRLTECSEDGSEVFSIDLDKPNEIWQHPWLLCHRIHLHVNLSKSATSKEGPGEPVDLRYSSKVTEIDPDTATVTLQNGDQIHGDVVIGADGVSSVTRKMIKGGHETPFSSGKSAFRFLVSKKEVIEDEVTKRFAQREGELIFWNGRDRRIVMYPCDDNKLMNFVCMHPSDETAAPADDWNAGGNREKMLEVYQNFDKPVLALLAKADPGSLKLWKLLDMGQLPTWTSNKLALLGDAAHPFLPHQGQGGGVAIEDAASLSVVLPLGTKPDEVAERLKLYESCRYERAHTIQQYTRLAGKDLDDPEKADMSKFTNYNFGHDEFDHSTKAFDEWRYARNPNLYWRMPVSFGPMPGPRQALYTNSAQRARHSIFTTASVKFKTSRTFLQNLFPTKSFSFKSPGTVAYASFSQTTLGKMQWLGGSGYNHFGLYLHGVEYTKRDGSTINGTYMPLLFESLADPIVSGREELGMPKLFCDIDVRRREHEYSVHAAWKGATFATLDLRELEESDPKAEGGTIGGESDYGILAYKYIPAVGERGKADAAYAVVVPHEEESKVVPSRVQKVFRAKKPSFNFESLSPEDLPTLHHVVSKLKQIPVYEYVSGKVVEGVGVPDVSSARRIE
ncbi:MAG: hypothetical protein Q9165_004805 [Trypethelium subeluteriae]